jgi:hypothetical protein
MTIIKPSRSPRIAAHTYGLPVVHELPRPVVDAAGVGTW